MFCCSKKLEVMKDKSNRKSLRWLYQGSSKKRGQFFSRSPGGEWGKSLFWAKIAEKQSDSHTFFILYIESEQTDG